MMRRKPPHLQRDGFAGLDGSVIDVFSVQQERSILQELADCKSKLAQALASIDGTDIAAGADEPQALASYISTAYSSDGPTGARLGAVNRRYSELRGKLALANLRLVAHVAKRFRDRGIPYTDLIQEGFCGLLEAIDRFDLIHQTKLATYATWWIRQSIQQAVASGAYPVRLTPRHLRLLARSQEQLERRECRGLLDPAVHQASLPPAQLIERIHTATRPALSLDAVLDADSSFNLLQTVSDSEGDRTAHVDAEQAVGRLLRTLRPREQEVLALRFGLQGRDRHSLSQAGRALRVSKERVRQIQDRALRKLRSLADRENLLDRLAPDLA
jgi:RNA polymerase primary sigma factor